MSGDGKTNLNNGDLIVCFLIAPVCRELFQLFHKKLYSKIGHTPD